MNPETRLQFVARLRHALIPDARAADNHDLAEDYETALQFICADVEALHDARKALLAASARLPPGCNAAALVAASVKEIEGITGPTLAAVPAKVQTPARRCLEDRSKLHD